MPSMPKQRLIAPILITLALLAVSKVAFANLSLEPQPTVTHTEVKSEQTVAVPEPVEPANLHATETVNEDTKEDPCTKTVTESNNQTEGTATNKKTTTIHCESNSEDGSSSVHIKNSNRQSATSGDSTGESGSVSNSDTTTIRYNGVEQ